MVVLTLPIWTLSTCPTLRSRRAPINGLGLEVTGRRLAPDRAVLACRVLET